MSLEITNLSIGSAGKDILNDMSFSLDAGEIVAILRSNGAGKSELVLGVAGMLPTRSGQVCVDGKDISGKSPDIVRASGVAAVPEGHKVLTQLSVDENLRSAGSLHSAKLQENLFKTYDRFPELAKRNSLGLCQAANNRWLRLVTH